MLDLCGHQEEGSNGGKTFSCNQFDDWQSPGRGAGGTCSQMLPPIYPILVFDLSGFL